MTSKLMITQQYFMKVVPEWYEPQLLSGEGTLEEQICEYEKTRVENDGIYVADLLRGETKVEFVENTTSESETLVTVTIQEVDRDAEEE